MSKQQLLLVLAALCFAALNPAFAAESIDTSAQPAAEPDAKPARSSISLEKDDMKRQLNNSLPSNAKLPPVGPPDGKVIATPSEKQKAVLDSVKIDGHGNPTKIAATIDGRPTIALALGGGGARGAAHIGVLRAFKESGIPVDYVVGNSMGAIVGGLYCAGVPLDRILTMMDDGSLRHAFMGMLPPRILISPLIKVLNIGHEHYAGLFSGKKFTRYLEKNLPEQGMDVQDTKIPFSPVATNLIDGKAYRISEGRLSTAIKASSAFMPIIQPVPIDDKLYIDGGIRANLPISAAAETGAGMVIGVLVDEPLRPVPAKRFKHLKWIASRMADVVLATSDERQLQYADLVINPQVTDIPILSKHKSDADKAEQAGYKAAMKAMPEIRKRLAEPPHTHSAVAGAPAVTQ